MGKGPWDVYVSLDFISHKTTPLSEEAKQVFLLLEGFAREKPYCYPGNDALVEGTGKRERAVQYILAALEKEGWIGRLFVDGEKLDRTGFILLRRTSSKVPAADTEEKVQGAVVELTKRLARDGKRAKFCRLSMQKNACASLQKIAPELEATGIRLNQVKKTSSSSRDDDDEQAPGDQFEEGMKAVEKAARECYGDDVARTVLGKSNDIRKRLKGRTEFYVAAIRQAFRAGKELKSPHGYFMTVAQDLLEAGVVPPDLATGKPVLGKRRLVEVLGCTVFEIDGSVSEIGLARSVCLAAKRLLDEGRTDDQIRTKIKDWVSMSFEHAECDRRERECVLGMLPNAIEQGLIESKSMTPDRPAQIEAAYRRPVGYQLPPTAPPLPRLPKARQKLTSYIGHLKPTVAPNPNSEPAKG